MTYSPLMVIGIVSIIVFLLWILWYSPFLFWPLWMHLSDLHHHDLEKTKKTVWFSYLISFMITFIKMYVLAHFIIFLANNNLNMTLQTWFWLRFWFVMTTQLSESLRTAKPKFWLIALNAAHQLVIILVASYLLYLWL